MEITTALVPGKTPVCVIRLNGNLDASSVDAFNAAAQKTVQEGNQNILVDMSGVPFMSSAGIRALHNLYSELHPSGTDQEKEALYKAVNAGLYSAPHLKLLNPSRKVEDVLKLAGLDMYLKSYRSEQEALAAF